MKLAYTTFLILGLSAAFLHAQAVPGLISYQGRIVDGTGVGLGTAPVTGLSAPVNRKILFRLFATATGGTTPLWSEEQTVTISKGDFSVILGQGVPATYNNNPEAPTHSTLLAALGDADRYLEIVVDNGDNALNATDSAIAPRQRLVSTAFAIRAASAASADSVTSGKDLNLKDANHGLGWYGADRLFNGVAINGPVLYGAGGGALGSVNGNTKNLALTWNSTGNVGIGTATPTEKLDIVGNGKFSANLSVGGNQTITGTLTAGTLSVTGNSSVTGSLTAGSLSTSGNFSASSGVFGGAVSATSITSSGGGSFSTNVTINNSSAATPANNTGGSGMRLTLWPGASDNTPFGFGIEPSTLFSVVPTNAGFKWYTGITERMKLDNTGNLGLGITPAEKLDVSGNIRASGIISSTGIKLPGGFEPEPTFVGTSGNYISFGHGGNSEDFIGYKNQVFYFRDSFAGGDSTQPSIDVGNNITAGGSITANGKTVAVGEESLRIIRGTISRDGVTLAGSGFTVDNNNIPTDAVANPNGQYYVRFNTAFSDIPTVTASSYESGNQDVVFVSTATKTGVLVEIRYLGGFTDHGVSFIAVGPR